MAMVEIRIFKDGESDDKWDDAPVFAYLPIMVGGEQLAGNIEKRVRLNFMKRHPEIWRVWWRVRGDQHGHRIDRM